MVPPFCLPRLPLPFLPLSSLPSPFPSFPPLKTLSKALFILEADLAKAKDDGSNGYFSLILSCCSFLWVQFSGKETGRGEWQSRTRAFPGALAAIHQIPTLIFTKRTSKLWRTKLGHLKKSLKTRGVPHLLVIFFQTGLLGFLHCQMWW